MLSKGSDHWHFLVLKNTLDLPITAMIYSTCFNHILEKSFILPQFLKTSFIENCFNKKQFSKDMVLPYFASWNYSIYVHYT